MASPCDDHFASPVLVPSPPTVSSNATSSHPSRSSASVADAADVETTLASVAADAGPSIASASRIGAVDDPAQAGHERVELGGGGALDSERGEVDQVRHVNATDSSPNKATLALTDVLRVFGRLVATGREEPADEATSDRVVPLDDDRSMEIPRNSDTIISV